MISSGGGGSEEHEIKNKQVIEIFNKIQILLNNKTLQSSDIYGNGTAGFQIAKILETVELTSHKTIEY